MPDIGSPYLQKSLSQVFDRIDANPLSNPFVEDDLLIDEKPPQLEIEQDFKMDFLEQSLEQLSLIQRQLVDQNASLKKNVSVAERKLNARSERIKSLEKMLQEAQGRLDIQRLDLSLSDNALDLKSISSTETLISGRIVKPLRGGGFEKGYAISL